MDSFNEAVFFSTKDMSCNIIIGFTKLSGFSPLAAMLIEHVRNDITGLEGNLRCLISCRYKAITTFQCHNDSSDPIQ